MRSPGEWLLDSLERDLSDSEKQRWADNRPYMAQAINLGLAMMILLLAIGMVIGQHLVRP